MLSPKIGSKLILVSFALMFNRQSNRQSRTSAHHIYSVLFPLSDSRQSSRDLPPYRGLCLKAIALDIFRQYGKKAPFLARHRLVLNAMNQKLFRKGERLAPNRFSTSADDGKALRAGEADRAKDRCRRPTEHAGLRFPLQSAPASTISTR